MEVDTGIWKGILARSGTSEVIHDIDANSKNLFLLGGTTKHQADIINTLNSSIEALKQNSQKNKRLSFSFGSSDSSSNKSNQSSRSPHTPTLPIYNYTYLQIPSLGNSNNDNGNKNNASDLTHECILNIHSFPGDFTKDYMFYFDHVKADCHAANTVVMLLIDSSKIKLYDQDLQLWSSSMDQLRSWIGFLKANKFTSDERNSLSASLTTFISNSAKYGNDPHDLTKFVDCKDPLSVSTMIVTMNTPNLDYKVTKSHLLDELQQTLRTIALTHCGSLFYFDHRSQFKHNNELLYSHLLNSLSPGSTVKLKATFEDPVSIPLGWDSKGKIKTLDDTFDLEKVLEKWQNLLAETIDDIQTVQQGATDVELEVTERVEDPVFSKPRTKDISGMYQDTLRMMLQLQQENKRR